MRPALFYYCLAQTRAADQDRRAQHDAPARVPGNAARLFAPQAGQQFQRFAGTISNSLTGNRTP
jgi:hypothetical protein